jgi:hypothetical protein
MNADRIEQAVDRLFVIRREQLFVGDSAMGNAAGFSVRSAEKARAERSAQADNR